MAVHKITAGLDLPITGAPGEEVDETIQVTRVAVCADDYPLMKPRMHVSVGDEVKRGQLLFEDRKAEGVRFTAPEAGKVLAVNRGDKRVLQTVVIELSEAARDGHGAQVELEATPSADMDGKALRALMAETGLWAALRARPYGRVPKPTEDAAAIFVTAIDTAPLAGSMKVILAGRDAELGAGLKALTKLTTGKVYLCAAPDAGLPSVPGVQLEEFSGKHPAGLPGTHIHTLEPVSRSKTVWHLGAQDVVALGALLTTGQIDSSRVVALGGPAVTKPRLIKTLLGARVSELTAGGLDATVEARCVAGSVLDGRKAEGEIWDYLGRYHQQVSCLAEDRERVFLGWLKPGGDKFSSIRAFAASWLGGATKRFAMTTSTHGSHRAMVPIGMFERVMPLDILPTFLLRALLVGDLERAEQLGCLELIEEDLSLCSFVSPGKENFAEALRENLDTIWKEG